MEEIIFFESIKVSFKFCKKRIKFRVFFLELLWIIIKNYSYMVIYIFWLKVDFLKRKIYLIIFKVI